MIYLQHYIHYVLPSHILRTPDQSKIWDQKCSSKFPYFKNMISVAWKRYVWTRTSDQPVQSDQSLSFGLYDLWIMGHLKLENWRLWSVCMAVLMWIFIVWTQIKVPSTPILLFFKTYVATSHWNASRAIEGNVKTYGYIKVKSLHQNFIPKLRLIWSPACWHNERMKSKLSKHNSIINWGYSKRVRFTSLGDFVFSKYCLSKPKYWQLQNCIQKIFQRNNCWYIKLQKL